MRECIVSTSGGPEVLHVLERPSSPVGVGQVRVKVHFAGVNFADLAVRAGVYQHAPPPPVVPGFEVSGDLVELGPGVEGFQVGDRVLAGTRFGGYADEVVADVGRVRKLPEGMSYETGAALLVQYLTAHHALTQSARVRRGEWVLVHAVAGGVGTAATQLARELGLTVIGTSSSDEKLAYARGQGAHHTLNYAKEDFEAGVKALTLGRGVDVVLDANAGAGLRKSFRCLAPGGRLVIFGVSNLLPKSLFDWPRVALDVVRQGIFTPFELLERNVSVGGVQVLLLWDDLALLGAQMDALMALSARGAIRPVVDQIFPLAEAAAAHRYHLERRSKGKVLLDCRLR
jgi:NADPH:quinone reductase-like Zn-dependent oxidoreductase